jgi:hypothetical protein
MSSLIREISCKLTVIPYNIIIDDMEYVSVEEAAGVTGYAAAYIRYLLRQKRIKAEKKGSMWWIDLDSLKDYKGKMDSLGNDKFFQWREQEG